MGSLETLTADPAARVTLAFLRELLADYAPRDFSVRLWDGTTWDAEPGRPARFTLVFSHPGAPRQMFWPLNELTLAEAYMHGDVDVEGDLEAVFPLGQFLAGLRWSALDKLRYARQLLSLPSGRRERAGRRPVRLSGPLHSKERDRQAVTYHYDVSNDFYALWLDKRMVYTCAYFTSGDDDLDSAQERKLDYVCRKLRLRPGERLLDIGCGWGGLVIYAAERYGAEAVGITLSRPQADLARQRIREKGLAARCRVEVCDYRDLDEGERYDKLASVGMFEHVGEPLLPTYFGKAWRLLRPAGAFLNHGATFPALEPARRGPFFSDTYVFPDTDPVPISTALRVAEVAGFEVRDVESLREHYALTMRHWVRRLRARRDEILRTTDEATYRAWVLFFAAAAYRFEIGRRSVYQTLLVKPDVGVSGVPLTRADWYA